MLEKFLGNYTHLNKNHNMFINLMRYKSVF